MKKNKFALQFTIIVLIFLSFIACDKDFATLDSDIINDENATNFDILSLSETNPEYREVITYTEELGPVQTNNLDLNTLGIYDDLYGRTTSNFLTQLTATTFDPDFGDETQIDSVVLRIPYFSVVTETDDDGSITYEIDSVIGREQIKLNLFESTYFIRDFDPNAEFDESQPYFSNQSASSTELISNGSLEGQEITILNGHQTSYPLMNDDNNINISENGFVLEEINEDGETQVSQRQSPGIRLKLDPAFWQQKIIDQEGEAVLSSANNFEEYFRGLYFKAEPVNNKGSFLILNTGDQNSTITIYYSKLTDSTTDADDERDQATFELRFGPNRINFMTNNFTTPINSGNPLTGDSRIYLKGGQGSIAKIKLFNGDNIDDDSDTTFEDWKNFFVETQDGKFVRSKRLVNEANLVFYVDQNVVENGEPDRLYLYDVENKTPLVDYFLDGANNSLPSFSRINHLGPLERVNDNGIKYKFKITEHINNLLLRDSTNVELGLAVSLNVNLEESLLQGEVQTTDGSDLTIPVSSVITPRGTVLHGNNTEDETKKVYLEIYYTEPN